MPTGRRRFIFGLGGGVFLDLFQTVSNTHQISVDFYFGDEVENAEDWAFTEDVSFEAVEKNLVNYTTGAINSIETNGSEVVVDVTVHTESFIDIEKVEEKHGESLFQKWRTYVNDSETDPEPESDSVILLTKTDHNRDAGRAEVPCQSCSSHNYSTGIVYDFNPYDCMKLHEQEHLDPENDPIPRIEYRSVPTVLHEVGHTLGLEHSDGVIKEDSQFALRSTLMKTNLYEKYDLERRQNYRLVEYNVTIDDINSRSFAFPFPELL